MILDMQRLYSFTYVGGNVSSSESMWSVCRFVKNDHFHCGSIASGIPFILSFPNQHRCQIGAYCAMHTPGSLEFNYPRWKYKIFADRQRYPLVWAGTYTCLVCIPTLSFPFLSASLSFPLVLAFVGWGLGASRPQNFYTDLGSFRVNLLLFWALEASIVVLGSTRVETLYVQTFEGPKQSVYSQF